MSVSNTQRGSVIGIDVGGTFTDFALFDARTGGFIHHKEASTPQDPALAIKTGLRKIMDTHHLGGNDLSMILHGTTIGLNTILQRKGASIALVVTEGFRDVFEIGRMRMASSFDFRSRPDLPLIPRERVVEIRARFDAQGRMSLEPDDDELERVAAILDGLGVAVAEMLIINGYANPDAEQQLASALQGKMRGIPVVSASRMWPAVREYERALVCCLSAYIQPLMQSYFKRLSTFLEELETSARLLITTSSGGSMSVESAIERPIDTILSGPASGAVAAKKLADECGLQDIISFDMGGTSSDIAVSTAGRIELTTHTHVGSLPMILPVVDVSAIGAGGGSIVWVDEQGVMKVGPESAGAAPGPAAYGQGGTQCTVTDCYLVLGILDPDGFLGGAMRLSTNLAVDAARAVGQAAGFTGDEVAQRAASGALQVATIQMATELQKTLAQSGRDPSEFTLIPYGGAGPTQANLLAREVGIGHVVVPAFPATFCAYGAATADVRRDFVQSMRSPLNESSCTRLKAIVKTLKADAAQWLAEQDNGLGLERRFSYSMAMRYAGQAYELAVGYADLDDPDISTDRIAAGFHAEHARIYGFSDPQAPIVLDTVHLSVIGKRPPLVRSVPGATDLAHGQAPRPPVRRRLYLAGAWVSVQVYDRRTLAIGQTLVGPAVIEQADTTILVLDGWQASTDPLGNLHLRQCPAPASSAESRRATKAEQS